jgi:hypothetical protein
MQTTSLSRLWIVVQYVDVVDWLKEISMGTKQFIGTNILILRQIYNV